jgi:hypothetical protein
MMQRSRPDEATPTFFYFRIYFSMMTFQLALPLCKLPYESIRDDVHEWQEERDYQIEYRPEDIGSNRFILGYTAYFDKSEKESDCREVCKAIRPDIYDWLMEHAPRVVVEMNTYEAEEEEIGEEDMGGDATVWVNFGSDHTRAINFKLRFADQ